ncbi:solute carrier family 25 member 16-like [Tubulanus polymorphus]|uniref:solute carrier family 25 member 16-like n=1 Tax=Tubulanus polymorphus TaxID=672921 RepID=UPI003DA5B8EF
MTSENVKTLPYGSPEKIQRLFKLLFAGGIAGMCAKTTIAPLDRIKILLQAHNQHYDRYGVISALRNVVKREGLTGLYRGNGTQMVRIFPYAALQFVSYENYKKILMSQLRTSHPHLAQLVAGSMAGMTAVLGTYPLDMVRARLAFQVSGEQVYSGIADAFQKIWKTEGGLPALYRGIVPTLMGMVPYGGFSFLGFETMKQISLGYFPLILGKPNPKNKNELVLNIPARLLCGGMAGAFAQTISYPLDVARRMMQLSVLLPRSDRFSNWFQVLKDVFREHGISRGLYRGMSINYLRVSPMIAVSFTTYETMKQFLSLDTGIDS